MEVVVVTWNILADCYSKGQTVSHKAVLRWSYRKQLIRTYLENCHADILLIQEADHFEDFLKNALESMGYTALYLQRPSCSDGCVIAFKNTKFYCTRVQEIHFDKVAERSVSRHIKFLKHNVAIVAELSFIDYPQQSFCVSCGHLHW